MYGIVPKRVYKDLIISTIVDSSPQAMYMASL